MQAMPPELLTYQGLSSSSGVIQVSDGPPPGSSALPAFEDDEDEVHTIIPVREIIRRIHGGGGRGLILLTGVQSNQFPRAADLAREFRAAGISVENIVGADKKEPGAGFRRGTRNVFRARGVHSKSLLRVFLASVNVGISRCEDNPIGMCVGNQ